MGKHRRNNSNATRKAVAASAVALGATAAIASPAQAAEVVVPGTGISVDIAGIETTPGLNNVPGIDQWIPSLSSQAAPTAYAAVIDAPAAEAQAAPAAAPVRQSLMQRAPRLVPHTVGVLPVLTLSTAPALPHGHTARLASPSHVPPRLRLHRAPLLLTLTFRLATSLPSTPALLMLVSTPATAPLSTH